MTAALTKREKKAAKFKNRKTPVLDLPEGADDGENDDSIDEAKADVTPSEPKVIPATESGRTAEAKPDVGSKSEPEHEPTSSNSGQNATTSTSKRRRRKQSGSTRTVYDENGDPHTVQTDAPKEDSTKYIVFVGNMSFDVTSDMLAKHMAGFCGETPNVRLLTKKGDPSAFDALSNSKKKSVTKGKARDPTAPQSRGCAFVEFTNATALQKALRFHHTTFHGRTINVELTAGGGGKSEQRKEKIKKKNTALEQERVSTC